jgi:hypothetical protein
LEFLSEPFSEKKTSEFHSEPFSEEKKNSEFHSKPFLEEKTLENPFQTILEQKTFEKL